MQEGETLGPSRPQTRAREMISLDLTWRKNLHGYSEQAPPDALGAKVWGFWPKKSRENPGESELSTWDYSSALPGCKASG
jgi:hypothetical protein